MSKYLKIVKNYKNCENCENSGFVRSIQNDSIWFGAYLYACHQKIIFFFLQSYSLRLRCENQNWSPLMWIRLYKNCDFCEMTKFVKIWFLRNCDFLKLWLLWNSDFRRIVIVVNSWFLWNCDFSEIVFFVKLGFLWICDFGAIVVQVGNFIMGIINSFLALSR